MIANAIRIVCRGTTGIEVQADRGRIGRCRRNFPGRHWHLQHGCTTTEGDASRRNAKRHPGKVIDSGRDYASRKGSRRPINRSPPPLQRGACACAGCQTSYCVTALRIRRTTAYLGSRPSRWSPIDTASCPIAAAADEVASLCVCADALMQLRSPSFAGFNFGVTVLTQGITSLTPARMRPCWAHKKGSATVKVSRAKRRRGSRKGRRVTDVS